MTNSDFKYVDECFADIQMLRYRLNDFESLSLNQKILVYCLSQATLYGRDITFDQFGKYNLLIRKTLEAIYLNYDGERNSNEFLALEEYLKKVWFSSGIYHHYGCDKFIPKFSECFFIRALKSIDPKFLPLSGCRTIDELCDLIVPVIFNPDILPVKTNKKEGEDLVRTSACTFYDNVTQEEVEHYYALIKNPSDTQPLSYGLNTTVIKQNGKVCENVWKLNGKYSKAIEKIIYWLDKASMFAENDKQRKVIHALIKYYKHGNLRDFNEYCIEWVSETQSHVDFINGFIEVYDDPLGLKGTWEGIVEYRDLEGTKRTKIISDNAQWFEDNSPIDIKFKKKHVKGVSANVICAAMLGGGEYPSTAIGINLPNADWIRTSYGSKSVTISNIIASYNEAGRCSGFKEEFVIDKETKDLIFKYGDICDTIHTDLHECLGHGSGQMLPNVGQDALKAYGNTIEEARADLFGLYYIADKKMLDLGLLPDKDAYKAGYYSYIMNGLLTQLSRIKKGHCIEEAHMRDRALIAHWCYEKGNDKNVIELVKSNDKTYVRINDYKQLRALFAELLAEVQRIKSEGDYVAARNLVEKYGVTVNMDLHNEILSRYENLGIPPYKGFINPILKPQYDDNGRIIDIMVDYTETYGQQMMRYSKEYSTLI